jgi:hypothetical protein
MIGLSFTTNDRFPETGRSELPRWERVLCPLVAVSSRHARSGDEEKRVVQFSTRGAVRN